MIGVFYMIHTSCVYHQEEHLYMQLVRHVYRAEITIRGYIRWLSVKC